MRKREISPLSPSSPLSPPAEFGEIRRIEETESRRILMNGGAQEGDCLPVFMDMVEERLPLFLRYVVCVADSYKEADVLCLGALAVFSSCMPNVSGLYDGIRVYPNLYFFLTARASSGKGRLGLCRLLVEPIHRGLYDQYRKDREIYARKMDEWEAHKSQGAVKPTPPVRRMLFIPANSSATSVYQILADNGERGLIFETEGDTLAYSFSSDFGNFSDGLRKAFHHEPISYHRRKDDEHVDIMSPKLSTVLSGTPGQLQALVRDAEDGLFSRFILYKLDTGVYWKDVFAASDRPSLNRRFAWLGERFAVFYRQLEECGPMEFKLTCGQAQRFNIHFSGAQMDFNLMYGEGIIASVRRLGLICYRIAMILSVVRMMEEGIPRGLVVCRDVDFETAMTITQVLESHTAQIYEELRGRCVSVGAGRPDCRERFLAELPDEFTRTGYSSAAGMMGITDRTAQRYIRTSVEMGELERLSYGKYRKVRQKNEK